jgi:putative membrane protein
MMHYWRNGFDCGFGVFNRFGIGGIGMMIFGILFIGVVIYFITKDRNKGVHYTLSKDPIDILKERYAKGEISEEEFDEKRKKLQ